jgi:hypothetical protein
MKLTRRSFLITSTAAAAAAAAAQKSNGSIISVILSVTSGSTLGQKLQGGGFNPNVIQTVNCAE